MVDSTGASRGTESVAWASCRFRHLDSVYRHFFGQHNVSTVGPQDLVT